MPGHLRKLLFLVLLSCVGACGDRPGSTDQAADGASAEGGEMGRADLTGVVVTGFSGPESVLHDTRADLYLVSNINGNPQEKDANGFISRVSTSGELLELRWIDGDAEGVTLNAPKGMGLFGDTLFVSDIDAVRLFDRRSGAPLGEWRVDGASFLNDIAVGPNGTVYVSDSGVRFGDGSREDTGTSGIHAFAPDGSRRTIGTEGVAGINGITVANGLLYGVASFGSGRIFAIENGTLADLPELPGLSLDGVEAVDDGLLISDWDTSSVYLLRENGSISTVVSNVTSPADIGVDRRRDRVLVPGLTTDQVLFAPLP